MIVSCSCIIIDAMELHAFFLFQVHNVYRVYRNHLCGITKGSQLKSIETKRPNGKF